MNVSQNIKLILEDGTEYFGKSFGAKKSVGGEVVFNTAMTGYPESLTDPSYKGQILVLTYPLIGNYGIPAGDKENQMLKYYESDRIHISGMIVSDYSFEYSHWNAEGSLVGAVEVINKKDGMHFTEDDMELCMILAEQAAGLLGHGAMFKSTEAKIKRFNTLIEVSKEITSLGDLHSLLEKIMNAAKKVSKGWW